MLCSIIILAVATSCNTGKDDKTTVVASDTITLSTDNVNVINTATDTGKMKNSKDTMPLKIAVDKNGKKATVIIVLPKMESGGTMTVDKQGYYSNVEIWPSYPGGQKALENFFIKNIDYPQQATENATEGTVTISFLVDEGGKVSKPAITGKKIGDGVEEEAMRVFNKMPLWMPGKIKGKNVKTHFTLPIRFQLS